MPRGFDPYHVWLGIPPSEQPPDHYRLLGVPLFEADATVIANAADQRMAHLRTFQRDKHARLSERLLNEVAAARVCLLNSGKKAAYDRQLRTTLQPSAPPAPVTPPPARESAGEVTLTYHRKPAKRPAAKPGDAPRPPRQLGDYQLAEKLGQGGMGAVYRGRHVKLDRQVALKILPKRRVADPEAVARFEREMRAVGRLDHPNVVRAHDAREIGGTCFLVMELVEGMDLARFVRRYGPLEVADACEVIRQAALGLQSAHEHGLVHRDVKPSNLMVNHQGQVKLLDLGLACFQTDRPAGDELTSTGHAMGTVDYIAPEQISDTRSVDIRADVYSLGCTFYKLLTGHTPFSGPEYGSEFEKMRGHLQEAPPSLSGFRSDLPEELQAIIKRMMAKEPSERYSTPGEVAVSVGAFAGGADLEGLLARAGHRPPPVVKKSQAEQDTGKSPSSGLTRFLRALKGGAKGVGSLFPAAGVGDGKGPGGKRLPTPWYHKNWGKVAMIAAPAAFGFLMLVLVLVYGFNPGPEEETVEDGKTAKTGSAKETGKSERPTPEKGEESWLVLKWPQAERAECRLQIDGRVRELSGDGVEVDSQEVRVKLPPGGHTVLIDRRGFQPFEQEFSVEQAKQLAITPQWQALAAITRTKQAVPPDDAIDELGKQIEEHYRFAEAQTAEEKLDLARDLLKQGKEAKSDPTERYVHFTRALELAIADGDEALAKEAIDAIEAEFDVPVPAFREGALGRLAQRRQQVAAAKKAAEDAAKAQQEAQQRLAVERARQQRYAGALEPVEKKVTAWDFQAGLAALDKIRFDDDAGLAAQLAQRRLEVQRLAALKSRIIDRIN
ncbi:MAG: serine/threonine-protein kinase, partial [Planctomycetota bacterium]